MMLIPARLRLIAAITVSALAALGWAAVADAQQTNDEVIKYLRSLPPGTPVEIQTSTTEQKADGQGASGQSTGDKANQTIDSTAPHVALPGVIANGGDTHAKQEASIEHALWFRILVGVVGLLIAAAGALGLYLGHALRAGAGTIAIGIGLAAAALWVDFALFVLLGVAGYGAVSLWTTGTLAAKFKEALRAVAAGVSDFADADAAAAAKLREEIASHASEADKTTIKAVRTADNLN